MRAFLFFKVKKSLKKADLFGQPIQLTFNNSPTSKSWLGGMLSLVLLSIFSVIALESLVQILEKSNLTAYMRESYESEPPFLDLSPEKLNWAVSFNVPKLNNWGFLPLFSLEITYARNFQHSNGSFLKEKRALALKNCEFRDFREEIRESFAKLSGNLSHLLCPQSEEELFVQGKYTSETFSYVSFKLSACKDGENSRKCWNDTEIARFFAENENKVNFQIYFLNNIVNINDLQKTVVSFVDDRIFLTIDLKEFQERNFFFTNNRIFTDQSLISTQYGLEHEVFTYENDYDSRNMQFTDVSQEKVFCSLYFRSNFISKLHYRTFEKIWKFLSFIGGVWSICYLFFSTIGKKYNRYRLSIKLANELFEFYEEKDEKPRENRQNQEKTKEKVKENKGKQGEISKTQGEIRENQTKLNKNIKNEGKNRETQGKSNILSENRGFLPSSTRIQAHFAENNPEFPKEIAEKLRKAKENKLTKSLKIFFPWVFFRKAEKRAAFEKQSSFRKAAFLEIVKDMDIVHILRKVKEIDKLKALILNENQRVLFDLFKKSKLSRRVSMTSSTNLFQKKLSLKNLPRFQRTNTSFSEKLREILRNYQAFLAIKADFCEKTQEINKKILEFLDAETLEIFEKLSFQQRTAENHEKLFQINRKFADN